MRPACSPATELDLAAQPARPRGARPERPEQLFGGRALVELRPAGTDELAQRRGALRLRAGEPVERGDIDHGAPDQLARGHGQPLLGVRGLLLPLSQLPGEAPYVARVEPAQRAGQQRLGPCGVDVVDVVGVGVVEVEHHA